MLEDRVYMRRSPFNVRHSAVIWLIAANVVAFGLECIFYGYPPRFPVGDYFALSGAGLRQGYVWQLLTFQFLHAGVLHLLLNCLAIFMFGRSIEEALGRNRFLALYFSGGCIGGLFQGLAGLFLGHAFSGATVGASAGAFALVAAFAMLYPERPVTVLFVLIPVTMRARTLLLGSAGLALFLIFYPVGNLANAAHLGGLLTGVCYVRWVIRWHWRWPRLKRPISKPQLVTVRTRKENPWNQNPASSTEGLSPDEFLSKQVDPILEKISKHGIASLNEGERKILETARQRMSKR